MNNNLKTKEQLVIEKLERDFKNENIVVTEQEKKITKLADIVVNLGTGYVFPYMEGKNF